MNLEVFTLCDAATVDRGKLNILGSFDTLSATSFPARHNHCSVVCKIRTEEQDADPCLLEMHIIDPDGTDVIPPTRVNMPGGNRLHHHLWHIEGFPLPKPGTFYIDLLFNGDLVARNPLYVRKTDSEKSSWPGEEIRAFP